MTTRKYSSRSQQSTLVSSITAASTNITVISGTALLGGVTIPAGSTFTLVIDPDTAIEEIVDATSVSTNNFIITRGIDGSSGQEHSAGAVVRHMAIGRDYREANTHIESTTGVHGATGAVVGTTDTQTLSGKTLTTPTINGATITGAVTNSATTTLTGSIVVSGGSITGLSSVGMSVSSATPKNYVDSILGSATSAAISAASAAVSASSAATSATASAASALASANSATASATSASASATSATAAATSAASAATSATAAATSATSAAASATAAATSATSASASASDAATSATSAATSYDSFDDRYLGAKATPPTLDNDGNALLTGALYWNTTSAKMFVWSGTGWADVTSTTVIAYLFNATAGQTTFSGADANALTLAYTVGAEQVYLNGVLQVRGSDYTASNGTSIVLTSGALVSDVLNVIAYSAMTITDTYTQAQADAKFVPQAANFFAGKNKIINGDFNVWQRGTSFSNPLTEAYTADRWQLQHDGSGATRTISQQTFTPGTAPVAGYEGQYFYRYAVSNAGTSNTFQQFFQKIEDVRTFAGQTVTLSFWAKADASRTLTLLYRVDYGTGGSAPNQFNVGSVNLTTSWARYSVTYSVPSVSGLTIGTGSNGQWNFRLPAATVQTVDFWGVQVEAGSVATPFQTATGTLAGELAACQRYYFRNTGAQAYSFLSGSVGATSTTQVYFTIPTPVEMRIYPTALDYGGAPAASDGPARYVGGTWTLDVSGAKTAITVLYTHGSSALTQYRPYRIQADNNASTYVGFSAEL